jgi:serine protease Do
VTIQELTRELAESFGLTQATGALISSVEKGGPADKAGFEMSDVILKFDGKTVTTSTDLPRLVAAIRPGTSVSAEVWRKGGLIHLTVTVAAIPEEGRLAQTIKNEADKAGKLIQRLGVLVGELTREQLSELQVVGGLLVEEVKGGRTTGLQRGDVLLAVGDTPLRSLKQFETLIRQIPKGRHIALLVRRGANASYVAVKLDENNSK